MSRKIYIIIAVVFTVVLSVSTFFIIRNHIDSAKQNEVYDNLAEIVEDEPPKENEGVTFSEDKDYLAEYLELYTPEELFCCGYAPYFMEGIKLRYPEYCRDLTPPKRNDMER